MHSLTSPSVMRRRASPGGGGAHQQRRGQVRNHPLLDPLQACYLCSLVVQVTFHLNLSHSLGCLGPNSQGKKIE